MNKLLSITLATLILASAALTACTKAPEGDWREEVTSVLSQMEKPSPVYTTPSAIRQTGDNDAPELGYINENAGQPHPITNPDADEIPDVSYGNDSVLVYGNQVYVSMSEGGIYQGLLHSVNLSDLISYDPQVSIYNQPVPEVTPLCFNPFCQHKTYQFNNGILCPLNFMNTGLHSARNSRPIYCIDYTESKGESPVFYIMAAEPEYKVVGEQVVENTADDYAIYRYDTAVGEREIIAEDLPASSNSLTICGEYIYYYSFDGLTAMDKKGKQVGNSNIAVHILAYENGVLYLSDSTGKIYTANADLSNMNFVYTVDTSRMGDDAVIELLQAPAIPFGYVVEDGYLYYCSDAEVIWASTVVESNRIYSSSVYRIPLDDLTSEPELLVDGQCYSGFLYGVKGNKLYFTPSINQYDNSTSWLIARCLAYVDLPSKKVAVLEEHAFDMPKCGIIQSQCAVLTSGFVVGYEQHYNESNSLLALYHFETGDILYISRSSMYGDTK